MRIHAVKNFNFTNSKAAKPNQTTAIEPAKIKPEKDYPKKDKPKNVTAIVAIALVAASTGLMMIRTNSDRIKKIATSKTFNKNILICPPLYAKIYSVTEVILLSRRKTKRRFLPFLLLLNHLSR